MRFMSDFLKSFKIAFLTILCIFGLGIILLGPAYIIVETGIEGLGWIYLLIFPTAIGYINACLNWATEW